MQQTVHPLPARGWTVLAALALGALGASASVGANAQAMPGHMMKPARSAELGTAAAIDARGTIWTVSKEVDGTAQYLVLSKSDDDGAHWSAPTRILSEPEAIAADGESRPKLLFGPKGEFYVSYSKPLAKPYTGDVRFIRSLDGGHTFSAPVTVHADRAIITHRFDALTIDPQGRIYVAWIDKRDLEQARARQQDYRGAAVYYAVSDDRGASFHGDYKVADHSCECCRIALATGPDGKVMALWRHVFAPNVRDHALGELTPSGAVATPARATFDDWHVDACPHQGPALAYAADGTRHQAWFTVKGEDGGVYYASAAPGQPLGAPVKLGSDQADHTAIAIDGRTIVLVWRQFDGKATVIMGRVSRDAGQSWREAVLASTAQASDHPQLLHGRNGIVLVWRTAAEGVRVVPVKLEEKQ
ncbi:exo-alpha-sialidase [Duganella sp. LX20W]|uniref:Exo-alpha-sialidase n=2 Tax=Rugamonas brunnea TaxID=2758569 RepID=A0A7W2EN63_9BURK|nr:exo-alpha-sialidase [Rugamonas brunnea]